MRRDFFKQRFTRDELEDILRRADLKPGEALSTRSTAYKTLGLAQRRVSEAELLELLVSEPTLLRRPLVVAPHASMQGFNVRALEQLIASAEGGER